jgi:hypothetical protein
MQRMTYIASGWLRSVGKPFCTIGWVRPCEVGANPCVKASARERWRGRRPNGSRVLPGAGFVSLSLDYLQQRADVATLPIAAHECQVQQQAHPSSKTTYLSCIWYHASTFSREGQEMRSCMQ